jgi:hypothetical protein
MILIQYQYNLLYFCCILKNLNNKCTNLVFLIYINIKKYIKEYLYNILGIKDNNYILY